MTGTDDYGRLCLVSGDRAAINRLPDWETMNSAPSNSLPHSEQISNYLIL